MSTTAGALTLKTAGLTGCVGGCVAAAGYWHTGMLAAVPAATGLTALAASDFHTHHFSLRTLRVASALVAFGLVIDAARDSAWDRLAGAALITGVIGLAVLAAWIGSRGIAFGDVLLIVFAVAVPARLSAGAAGLTMTVAMVVAGAIVIMQRRRRPASALPATVALGPALLAGWAVAMVLG